jgi:hypothetical protein
MALDGIWYDQMSLYLDKVQCMNDSTFLVIYPNSVHIRI